MDTIEKAHEDIEHAHQVHERDPAARWIAVIIAAMAASLAIAEIGEKAAQTAYVNHNIALSDDWGYYQAKNIRATMRLAEVEMLASLPNASDPGVQERVKAAQQEANRLRDDPKGGEGAKQLAERAQHQQEIRDHALHRNHQYEAVVGALQIAILITSVSLLVRARFLTAAAGLLGAGAIVFGLLVWGNLV